MKKLFIAGVESMAHFSVECDCGEMVFSHQFEFYADLGGDCTKGTFVCPHCLIAYEFQSKLKTFSLAKTNVSDN